jgi:hypothetical protein
MTDNISGALTKLIYRFLMGYYYNSSGQQNDNRGYSKKLRVSEDKVYVNVTYLGILQQLPYL